MNFTLFFAFLVSLISLFKDLYKGFEENRTDVFFDISFVLLTLIPCLMNLIYFIRRDCPHSKILLLNLNKFLRLDSYDEYYRNSVENGSWMFCNQTEDWEKSDGKNYDFIQFSSDEPNCIYKSQLNPFDYFSSVNLHHSHHNSLYNYLKMTKRRKIGDHIEIRENGITIIDQVTEKIEIDVMGDDFIKNLVLHQCQGAEDLNFNYMKLNVEISGDIIRLKHREGKSNGFEISSPIMADKIMFIKVMENLEENKGVIVKNSTKFLKTTSGYNFVSHYLSIQQLWEILENNDRFLLTKGKLRSHGGKSFIMGMEMETTLCLDHSSKFSLRDNVKDFAEQLHVDLNYPKKFVCRFGEKLGCFLFEYTHTFFGKRNKNALDYLLNRTSCWNYRLIGKNWQSKRFLSDVNFIFKTSGHPLLTHIDKKVLPSKLIQNMESLIPPCDILVKRKVFSYNLEDFKEKISLMNIKRKEKNYLGKFLTGNPLKHGPTPPIIRGLVKDSFKTVVNDPEKNLLTRETNYKPYCAKYSDILRRNLDSERVKNIHIVNDYLMKSKRCLKKDFLDHKEYVQDLMHLNDVVKDETIRRSITISCKKVGNDKRTKIKIRKNVDLNKTYPILKNYYSCLIGYEEKLDEELKDLIKNRDDYTNKAVRAYFDPDLGLGKNTYNISSILSNSGNKKSIRHLRRKVSDKQHDFLIGVESTDLNLMIFNNLNSVPVILPVKKYKKMPRDGWNRSKRLEERRRKKMFPELYLSQVSRKRKNTEDIEIVHGKKTLKKKNKTSCEKVNLEKLKLLKKLYKRKVAKLLRKQKEENDRLEEKKRIELLEAEKLKIQNDIEKERIKKRLEDKKKENRFYPEFNAKLTSADKGENRIYWAIRTVSKYVLLDPPDFDNLDFEEYERISNSPVKLEEIDEVSFPCIYNQKYFVDEKTMITATRISVLKKMSSFIRENRVFIYKVIFN